MQQEIGVPFKLVSTDHIVQYAEKRQLAGRYKAVLVDMEAGTVARFARSRQIPFYCLKAISDEISDILPDFGRYTGPDGRLALASVAGPRRLPAEVLASHAAPRAECKERRPGGGARWRHS